MKNTRLLTLLIACGASLALCPGLKAQDASPAPAAPTASGTTGDTTGGGHHHGHRGGGPGGPGRGMNSDKMLAHMTTELGLSADQQAKIKPILDSQQTQMQALRADTATAQADKRGKFKAIHESTVSQINAVLTPDQQTKYAAAQAERKEHRGGGRRGGKGGGGAGGAGDTTTPAASPAAQ